MTRPSNIFNKALSGGHGLKDFLCIDHLLESFYCGSYSLKHLHKSTFHHKRTQEDGHYRENPSNHELLRVRGVHCRALLKCLGVSSHSNRHAVAGY